MATRRRRTSFLRPPVKKRRTAPWTREEELLARMAELLRRRMDRSWDPRCQGFGFVMSDQFLPGTGVTGPMYMDFGMCFDGKFRLPATYFGTPAGNLFRYPPGASFGDPTPIPDGYRARVLDVSCEGGWIQNIAYNASSPASMAFSSISPGIYDPGDWVRWSWIRNGEVYPGAKGRPIATRTLYGNPSYSPTPAHVVASAAAAGVPIIDDNAYRRICYPGTPPLLAISFTGGNAAWQAVEADKWVGAGLISVVGGASGVVAGIQQVGGAGIIWIYANSDSSGATTAAGGISQTSLAWLNGDALVGNTNATGLPQATATSLPIPVGEPPNPSISYQQFYHYPGSNHPCPPIHLQAGDKSYLRIENYAGATGDITRTVAISIAACGIMWPTDLDVEQTV